MKHLPDEKLNKGLLFAAYAFLIISAGLSVYMLIDKNIDYPLGLIVVDLISIVIMFLYFVKGYTKDVAKYFKLAMLFEASTYIIDYLYLAINPIEIIADTGSFISLAIVLVMYGNTLIVAVAKDLGKRASFLIYGSNTCLYIINLLTSIKTGAAAEISSIIWLLLSLVGLIMIEAKYIDKGNRVSH